MFVFEITPRCNLECRYCYNVWKSNAVQYPDELSLNQIEILAGSVAITHPVSVTLTGGEPLVRDDIEEIASAFQKRGMLVGIATNGILLDRFKAESLKRAGVSWFEISIPSISDCGYRNLTGVDGLSDVKHGMLAAKSTGARLTVSHIITASNYEEAGRVVELGYAFSADAVALNRFVPGGRGYENRYLLPSREQLDFALRSAGERSRNSPGMPVYAAIPIEDCILNHIDYPGITFGTCTCGEGKWAISPSGELRVCEQSPHSIGSLLDKPFEELSGSAFVKEFRSSNRRSDCPSCTRSGECGGGCRFLQAIPID